MGMPRTQNSVESWHSRLNILIGCPHPHAFTLVKEFQKEEHQIGGVIRRMMTVGTVLNKRREHYLARENLIIQCLNERSDYDTLTTLERLVARIKCASSFLSTA